MKSHCPDFKPSPTASWICAWWESEYIGVGECGEIVWFCSRPDWDERVCPTQGLRFAGYAPEQDGEAAH